MPQRSMGFHRDIYDSTKFNNVPHGSTRFHKVPQEFKEVPQRFQNGFDNDPQGSIVFHEVPSGFKRHRGIRKCIRFAEVRYGSVQLFKGSQRFSVVL